MATPTGARHRDVEQRLRDLEDALRTLTGATLRRRQLGVAEGDFVVQGGGSVIVKDGGGLRAEYPGGGASAYFGPVSNSTEDGDGLLAKSVAGTIFAAWQKDSGPTQLWASVDEAVIFGPGNSSFFYLTPTGDAQVQCAPGDNIYLRNHTTTAAGANCYLDAGGAIQRSTSSLRYKTDVQLPHIDVQAVLALQPKRYRTKAEVAELGEDAPTYVGFIAEDAADLDLHEWVVRDQDGRVDAFNYAQWGVAQQAVLQDHQARIAVLEDTVAAQADTIKALTARLDAAGL